VKGNKLLFGFESLDGVRFRQSALDGAPAPSSARKTLEQESDVNG
jgi:hypothetical protein